MSKLAILAALGGTILAAPLAARTLVLSGTFANTNAPAAPGGRCPALTVNISNVAPFHATGTSNFGDFTSVQSHCLTSGPPVAVGAAPVPYDDGRFTYSFASGATLSGTYTGLLTNSGVMGVIDNVQTFVVTGGSGVFANASGGFVGTGTIHFAGGPPAATLTIDRAQITVPGVPEPVTWTLMIAGFGLTGAALRRRTPLAVAA